MQVVIPGLEAWLRLNLAMLALGVLSAIVVMVVGVIAARIGAGIVRGMMMRSPLRNRALLINFATRTTHVVVGVFAAVIALSQLGLDVGPLIAGIGITGFIVGFAFKDSLSNLAAGLLLLFYQPFEVGDFVETGGQSGTVLDMSIAATELKMPDGRLAIVPNSRIWNAHIINFNRLGRRRIEWTVAVPHAADLGAALEVLRGVVGEERRVLAEPAPEFVVQAVGPANVELAVRAWVDPQDVALVSSDLRRAFKEGIQAAGI